MINLLEIKKYAIPTPESWSCFGSPQNFEALPQIHQEQIFFLSTCASNYILEFLQHSNMINCYGESKYHRLTWQPFPKSYFKSIKKLVLLYNENKVKKWMFDCGIPFKRDVFLITDSENVILTSWKIVIKYSDLIFADGYAIVFDESINWCLYNRTGQVYFGKNNMIYQLSKVRSFTVFDSFYLSKIGLLVLMDTGDYMLKANDILFLNSSGLEWVVVKEYQVSDNSLTLFLLANDHFKKGKKLYLLSPINGKHKPVKNEILFLKRNLNL